MSPRYSKKNKKEYEKMNERLKQAAAVTAAAAAGAAGMHYTEQGGHQSPNYAQDAANQITEDLALNHEIQVAGGKAVIRFDNGVKIVVEKPILDTAYNEQGDPAATAVAERTRGSDTGETTAVTSYVAGEDGVSDVSIVEGGKTYTPAEAANSQSLSSDVQLQRSEGLSGEGYGTGPDSNGDRAGYFTPTHPNDDAQTPNEHIAQGAEYDTPSTN